MDKTLRKFIENLANTEVKEFSDYRAKQEFEEFVLAARCIIKMHNEKLKLEKNATKTIS